MAKAPPQLARVLVTGGQGFLGAYVLRDLLQRFSEVALLDLQDSPHVLRQVLTEEESSRVRRVFVDVTNAAAVNEAVLTFRPTAVIHLAGLQIPSVKENPTRGAAVNVIGTINVFEAIKALAAEQRSAPIPVAYASSAAVLGPSMDYPAGPIPAEQHYHKPRTLYGVMKLCNEGTARVYWQDYQVPSVGLRPLTVFGVGREIGLTSAPTKAVKAAVLGRRFECQVTGLTGFQYVADVARIFVDSVLAAGSEKGKGAHVFGMKGHLATYEEYLRQAAVAVPALSSLAWVAAKAPEVPIHGDVDEAPLAQLLGRKDLHMPLADAVADMAARFQALRQRGALSSNDLGPEPPAQGKPVSKL